ncbi:MAG TPA: hypothetical protein ENI87_00860 [bacterium]|nr:hypothetical protein [bacterium]
MSYSYGLLFLNEEGRFREVHRKAGIEIWGGYGSAFADIDSDGRLDVVVCGATEAKGPPIISFFRNQTEGGEWVGFDLLEAKGVQTVGTKVLLLQERGVQLRQVATTMGSHGQQNDSRIHFGLGEMGAIVDVLVYWPGGRIQSLGTPAPGKYHTVRRKASRKQKKLHPKGPERVAVGESALFTVTPPGRGWKYYWDLGGSRLPEYTTDVPELRHVFEHAGQRVVTVLAVHPRLGGCEARLMVRVVE